MFFFHNDLKDANTSVTAKFILFFYVFLVCIKHDYLTIEQSYMTYLNFMGANKGCMHELQVGEIRWKSFNNSEMPIFTIFNSIPLGWFPLSNEVVHSTFAAYMSHRIYSSGISKG